jgi:hypothetical protein
MYQVFSIPAPLHSLPPGNGEKGVGGLNPHRMNFYTFRGLLRPKRQKGIFGQKRHNNTKVGETS